MWVKGNTHTHTTMSDGTSSPKEVAEWYKKHGYSFLVITDHHSFTDPISIVEVQTQNFILIPGEELTSNPDPCGRPVHVCALGINRVIEDPEKDTVIGTLRFYVGKILSYGGIPIVAHPNYKFGLHYKDLEEVANWDLFEIYNHSSSCNNEGSIARLSVEQVWDMLLSKGRDCYAVAADDSHHFDGEHDNNTPGGGWIWVKVDKLTPEDVLNNLAAGNFYASTGPELSDYSCDSGSIHISVKPEDGLSYSVRFIGKYGQILQDEEGLESTYKYTSNTNEAYVRAKIIGSDCMVAWTQPIRKGDMFNA